MEVNVEIPQKAENRSIYTPFGHIPKVSTSYYQDAYSSMFLAALFTMARSWEEPRCPPTDE